MTYYSDDGGDGRREEVVPDLTVTIEADDNNGDYVKLMPSPDEDSPLAAAEEPSVPSRRSVVWYWVKLVLLFLCLGFLAVAVLKWVGPYLIDKVCSFPLIDYNCIWIVLCSLGLVFFPCKALILRIKMIRRFCRYYICLGILDCSLIVLQNHVLYVHSRCL